MSAAPPTLESLAVEDADGVRLVTLRRPERLNAFDVGLFEALAEALGEAAVHPELRCVVLTGEGRAFTAGSDLAADAPAAEDAGPRGYDRLMPVLERFSKPLVAAVNGLAVGIGVTMLGHCDVVLAAASARFRLPFTSLGLVPEAGATATLPRLLGPQLTAELLFTSRWMAADEAAAAGLARAVVPDDELRERALDLAREIAAMPVEALEATKRLLLEHRAAEAPVARSREDAEFRRLAAGPAHARALAAFQARRGAGDRRPSA